MSLFGELQVRLDPWQVDYGTELPLEDVQEGPDEGVVLDIELAAGEWRPLTAGETHAPSVLVFVDGVRRLEARLIVWRGEQLCHGAFGSYGVGAVHVANEAASCLAPNVGRLVIVGSGESLLGSVMVAPGLSYRPVSTLDSDPDAPLRAIQERMRLAEERLGKELANTNHLVARISWAERLGLGSVEDHSPFGERDFGGRWSRVVFPQTSTGGKSG